MIRLLLAGLLALAPLGAAAAQRLALVIGNASYTTISSLRNPVEDARLMAQTLEAVGFEVTLLVDSGQTEIKRAIAGFGRALRGAGPDAVGLFYFAGHGVQAGGANYLLPVDGEFVDEADLDIFAINANWVLGQMESAGAATNIVILDACRNNPLASSFRSSSRGLARMNAPTGSFVAYATSPGDVAQDGDAGNSPYTLALARAIATGGQPIEQTFKAVRVDVLRATGGAQTPWDSSSLVGEFFFAPPGAEAPTPATWVPGGGEKSEEPTDDTGKSRIALAIEGWAYFKDSDDIGALTAFAEEFADTPFGSLARARIASLRKTDDPPAPRAANPDPPATTERPSWCPKARTSTEKAICANDTLSGLDLELSRIYRARLKKMSTENRKRAVKSQRAWLGLRNACESDFDCIAPLYRNRIETLTR